ALVGELMAVLYSGSILQPAYLAVRTVIAVAMFYAVSRLVRGPDDLIPLLKAVVAAVLFTSVLMILTSLPMTRSWVTNSILSLPFLEPAAEGVSRRFLERISLEDATRGRSLVGVSILSATFINVAWPLVALVAWVPDWSIERRWRLVAQVVTVLAPLAVVMSYSRGPLVGTVLMVLALFVIRVRRVSSGILVPIGVAAVFFLTVGLGSQLFFFERLQNRAVATLNNPFADEREFERILAYVEPFEHVADLPQFLLVGEGVSLGRTGVVPEIDGKASHAMFAAAYYSYGMVAVVLYHWLIIAGGFHVNAQRLRRGAEPGGLVAGALVLSVLAIVPWAAFGHAMVTEVRGAMLFFFVFGLIAALSSFPTARSQSLRSFHGRAIAHGRPAAV
ncbi:MAG: hypothetical protein AAFV62_01065, partial [Pseudomonadota bacterium]